MWKSGSVPTSTGDLDQRKTNIPQTKTKDMAWGGAAKFVFPEVLEQIGVTL